MRARAVLRIAGSRWVVLFALLAGVLIPYVRLLEHPESRLLHSFGNQETDASFTLRDYWATAANGSTPFTNTHDPYMGAPEGVPVAASVQVANALQPAVIWLLKPVLGLVGAWNALLLIGVVGTAAAFYAVLLRLRVPAGAAALAAYGVTASPWFLVQAQAGHVGLLQEWPMALVLPALAKFHEAHSARAAILVGVLWAASFYAFNYVGAFVSLLLVVAFAVLLLERDRAIPRLRICALGGATLCTTIILLLPALLDVLLTGVTGNPLGARNLGDFFGSSLRFFVIPSHYNPLLQWIYDPHIVDEQQLYLSVTLLCLAGVTMLARRVAVAEFEYLRAIAGVTFVCGISLALPHNYRVLGAHVPMPATLLAHVTTVFDINARFGYLALVMLAMLGAFGLTALSPRTRLLVTPLALALLVVEFAFTTLPTWQRQPPPHDVWLASHPGGIVAYYPMFKYGSAFAAMENEEYSFQPIQRHPIFNMFPVTRPDWLETREFAIRAVTKSLTDETAAGVLAAEGVKWVVVRDDVEHALGETPPTMPPAYYRLVARFPEARIFRVVAPPVDVDAVLEDAHTVVAWSWGAPTPTLQTDSLSGSDLAVVASPGAWNEGYQMQVNIAKAAPGRQLLVIDDRGEVLARAPAQGLVTVGPFSVQADGETLHLKIDDGSHFALRSDPAIVPYAYYARSVE
jgi:hypothetical protein